ncbi:exodeoxyribonuclease VII small subunit [Candidatus Saccharibacteria bacterium RIFCSPHIGHO2_12_FULL_47_17]|nr:MAG: exodeoxyribonuclease VII small subunit [Candidatus Saccharibacteria bacterium RIFCSPHIGHO2_12_FULL_47_17]
MAKSKSAKDYQQLADELEEIILWFESGQVTLDEAIKKYEQASQLIAEMEEYLKNAENKIKKINATFKKKS